jgi:hypothetical protein
VVRGQVIPLPFGMVEAYRSVTLAFDIMYVNKIPFLATLSRGIKFGMAHRLNSRKESDVAKELTSVVKMYKSRGF